MFREIKKFNLSEEPLSFPSKVNDNEGTGSGQEQLDTVSLPTGRDWVWVVSH